jgi:hypothetical protein
MAATRSAEAGATPAMPSSPTSATAKASSSIVERRLEPMLHA